jgi:hypothetical protein
VWGSKRKNRLVSALNLYGSCNSLMEIIRGVAPVNCTTKYSALLLELGIDSNTEGAGCEDAIHESNDSIKLTLQSVYHTT